MALPDSPSGPPAPHGPHAARQVAERLAAAGAHSHLATEDQSICLSGLCLPTGGHR
ncbi:hypothetical protein GCM10010327_67960 [Streptomyces nitrosporeus]|nr:hypothetical protein GCM10010327_67960 [Streptomyces nitrosporeus]